MREDLRGIARDARLAVREGEEGIARRQRARLAEMVAYARAHSPYYRELYHGLPDEVDDPTRLPVTRKQDLMARFDDCVTDREVTREQVEAFTADPDRAGQRFLGRYLVATTSGTSGLRGLFVLDDRAVGMEAALASRAQVLAPGALFRLLVRGNRTALLTAPRGHFFTIAAAARFRLDHPWFGRGMRVFSIHRPMDEIVDELNRFRPAVLTGFPGMLLLLAREQEAGRLRIRPTVVVAGGETLTDDGCVRLSAAFKAEVRSAYAATECGHLAFSCAYGWYHVNSDWTVLEPVDADHRPVPPGRPSHTVLLSNLANRVQPILRYDLGDSVLVRPDPCPCGSVFPAVQVQGRAADLLTFPGDEGDVALSPMVFATLLDGISGIDQFQLVQTAPGTLRVRLRASAEPDQVWRTVHDRITRLLADHGVAGIALERADEPPRREPGGKFRRIVPLGRT